MIHRIRVSLVCLGLCLSTFASNAQAQFFETSSGSASLSDYAVQDDFGGAYMFGNDGGTYLLFQKMIGDGTGFTASYQRIGLRAKLIDLGDSHLWSEGHMIITDESRMGFNLGGGYRWVIDGNVLGVHGWYDNFQSDLNNRYTQTSFGVELLHEDVDLRANAYFPFGDEENFVGIADEGSVPIFDKRRIAFIGTAYEEQAMKGFDAEVGVPILRLPWARAYAGGYYYESQDGETAPGARGRIETAISDDLSLNFSMTNDRVFNTNYNLGVEYRFSGGVAPPVCNPFHGWNRKYAQVRRQWPIATRVATVPALYDSINPRTGLPYKVTHVDNTNAAPGDGTFENPFQSLPSTAPGSDFVLVRTGVGETLGNITLDPFTRMLGEGKPYRFVDARRGEFLLPEAFGRTGPAPILRPTTLMRDVITIASNVEVNNFIIRAPGQTAIGGMDVTNFLIESIGGNAENGINIVNASGHGTIRGFGAPGIPFLLTDTGIFVSNTGGDPLHLDLESIYTTSGEVGVQIAAAGGNIHSTVNGMRADNHMNAGLILSALAGSEQVTRVNDAVIRSSLNETDRGIVLDVANGGAMAATMTNVGADGNGDLFQANVTDGSLNATITNPNSLPYIFSNSRMGNGVKFNLDNAVGRTTFNGLVADRNDVDGLNAEATGMLNDYTINVIDSELVANGDDNIDTTVTGGADLRLFVDPTLAVLSQNGSGFEFEVRDPGSVLIADFIETNLSQNALHAVDGTVLNGGYANLAMLNSLATDSGVNGLNLNIDRNAEFRGFFDTGSFSRSGANGVEVAVSDGSNAELNFFNNPADHNGANGLLFEVSGGINGGSNLVLNVMNGDFSDNPLANVRGSSDGAGSLATLNFTNTTASNRATVGGLVLDATHGGRINTNWNLGTISNILNDGVRANVDGPGSHIDLNLAGLTIQNNLGNGVEGSITNGGPGSVLDINLTNTTVQFNAGNGVDVTVDGPGATSHVDFVNSPIVQNVGDGFEFDVLGGADLIATATGAGSFSGNGQRAWHGTIDGMGSAAALSVTGIDGDFSGLEGGRFDVTGGGLFNLTMFDVNVTGSGLDGLLTSVDGPMSRANLRLDTVRLRNNGQAGMGDGFQAVASNDAYVLSELDNMMATGNRDNGFRFDTTTGAISMASFMDPNATENGRAGLRFNTDMAGRSSIRVEGGSFSNNGTAFPASGVEGLVRGLGTTANVFFDGSTSDMNSRHGFDLQVDTGARLTAKLVTFGTNGVLSASDNSLSGVRFNALNGGPTHGNLLMLGANQINNNSEYGVDYDALNIEQAIAGFDGSASSNGFDGVNIRMEGVTRGSVHVPGNSVVISNNGGDGYSATVINTTLGPINVGPFNTPTGIVDTVQGLSIDSVTAESNMGHGIVFRGIDSTIVDGEFVNNLANENQGNGLFVMLTNTMADNLHVNTNNASDNTLNGINVELIGSPIDGLQMNDNGTLSAGTQNVGLTFFIQGQTLVDPFSISNSSDPGVDITNFSFDLSTSVTSAIFNTETGAFTAFAPVAGTDVTTGLTAVNGTAVPPYPNGLVPDFTQLLALDFNDFNAGETFIWNIDTDLTPGGDEAVFGNELIGSSVVVDFSNGAQLTGALMAVPGQPDASIFIATGGTGLGGAVANNGLNGIRLFADNSDLTNLSMSGNVSMANGDSGVLIDTINGSDVTGATLASNDLTMNGNGGLVLDFDNSSLTDATISDSNISSNTGDGILFDFMNSPITNLTIQDNPNIDQNTGNGVNFQMVNSNINGLLMDNNGIGTVIPPTPAGAFDITLNLQAGLTPTQIAAFQAAEQRWESIITGDVPDIGLIDDLVIDASVVAIDGPGGILGQAGPDGLRAGSFIPFSGIMQFDSADLAALEAAGQLEEVILHEMGHVLGFGTIWDNLGLIAGPASIGGMDPRFTGAQATAQYNAIFGNMDADIPVEATGGPGTADSHWRETVFTNELMTGFLDPGVTNPISAVTIAQFADLGYTVDLTQADPFIPAPLIGPGPTIVGDVLRPSEEQIVDPSEAASSGIAALQIGSAGITALQAIQQNGLHGINISLTNSDLTGGVLRDNIVAGHTGGDGVRLVNPTTMGNAIELDFDGNTINGNTGGRGVNMVLSQADINSMFTDNEIAANGSQAVNIDLSNSVAANLTLTGNTLSGNGAEGLLVSATDMVTLDTFNVDGNTASNNGNDGIGLFMTDATSAPTIDINNNTANENGANGLHVALSGTASIGTLNVDGNTAVDNADDGILIETGSPNTINSISVSDSVDISGNGANGIEIILSSVLSTPDVAVNGNSVTGNTLGGIVLAATSTPLGAVTVDGNMVLNNAGGDGILLQFDNAVTDSVSISDNLIGGASGNGINLDLVASPINDLQINNNMMGMAFGGTSDVVGLGFFIDGNTFGQPFSIENTSDVGNDITLFQFDLSTAVLGPDLNFNTETGAALPFAPENGTEVTTGLAVVNGNNVPPFPPNTVPDFSQQLVLGFTDFNATEVFEWVVDVDQTVGGEEGVTGDELIGSSVIVDFSNGSQLTGALMAVPGNLDASIFVATGGNVVPPSTGDGIRISATAGSNIGTMNVDDNTIAGSGAHGIEMIVADSTLPGMASISGNTISNHASGDAIRIIDPDTNNTAFGITFDNNTLVNNTGGSGMSLSFGNESGEFTGVISDSEITGNGGDGVSIQNTASANAVNIDMTGVTSSDNAGRGVFVAATNDNGARSTFNIGEIGGAINTFEGNGQDAVVFRTQATAVDQTQSAANTDVMVLDGQNDPAVGAYIDSGSNDLVRATMNLLNARVFGNGGNGVVLEVGSNTLMNSQIAGLQAGSNGGDDVVITPIVSVDPPDSIDDLNPNMDTLVFDPVAHLDLALGAADTNNDMIPDATAATRNTGDAITVNFTGDDFTNLDPFKNDRAVRLFGQIQILGQLNSPQNVFSTGGVITDIEALFNVPGQFFIIPANTFPDNTVP